MAAPKDLIIYGCCGDICAGKDTVGRLMYPWGFRALSFGDALKDTAIHLGWNGKKDEEGRRLLQHTGDVGREYNINIWVEKLAERLEREYASGMRRFVIPDCRLENEILWVVKTLGGKLLWVRNKTAEESARVSTASTHKSETDWKRVLQQGTVPYVEVNNNGTLPETFHSIHKILTEDGVRLIR
jgi:hypothetical protein